ncbi:MAG: hypothetical protein HFG75_00125 [Hungatella sp.]|nr:hypothetical protein [Hungatella sp.]
MSSISIKWSGADMAVTLYGAHRRELSNTIASVRSIRSYRSMRGRNFTAVYRALDKVISSLEEEKQGIKNLETGLSDVLKAYRECENGLAAPHQVLSDKKKKEFNKWTMKDTWKLIGKGGIIGAGVSAVGSIVTEGWSLKSGIAAGKSLSSMIGGISGTIAQGSKADWSKSLFGFNSAVTGLDTSSFGKTFTSSWGKQFGKDLSFKNATTAGGKVKVATKWAGHLLTLAGNVVDNVDEYKKRGDGNLLKLGAEIAIETGVDIAIGGASTAFVTAVLVPLGPGAILVGAGSVAVTWAANGLCKWVTGKFGEEKDLAEVASDVIFYAADKVGKAGKALGKGVKAIAKWGKKLFG